MTPNQLLQLQSLPITAKLEYSKQLVKEWYEYWNGEVAILFSGGKDSTVTMNIVQDLYPEVPALFVDTGMEYPEIYEFISQCKNVKVLIPDFTYEQVIKIIADNAKLNDKQQLSEPDDYNSILIK